MSKRNRKEIFSIMLKIIIGIQLLFLLVMFFPLLLNHLNNSEVLWVIHAIDHIHNPYYYLSFTAFVMIPAGFLPKRQNFENRADVIFSWMILFFLFHMTTVFLSQGMVGGCVYNLPQNYLARTYLGQNWYPLGLVMEEKYATFINLEFLRLLLLILGLFFAWLTAKFYHFRIKYAKVKTN